MTDRLKELLAIADQMIIHDLNTIYYWFHYWSGVEGRLRREGASESEIEALRAILEGLYVFRSTGGGEAWIYPPEFVEQEKYR